MDASLLDTDMLWTEFLGALGHLALSTKPADIPDAAPAPAEGEGEGEGGGEGDGAGETTDSAAAAAGGEEAKEGGGEAAPATATDPPTGGEERPGTAASAASEAEPATLGRHLEVMFARLELGRVGEGKAKGRKGGPRRARV